VEDKEEEEEEEEEGNSKWFFSHFRHLMTLHAYVESLLRFY